MFEVLCSIREKAGAGGSKEAQTPCYSRGLPGKKLSAFFIMVTMHFTSQDCKKVKYKGTSKIGTLMPCRVIRSAAVVISSLNLHQSNLFFFFLLAVCWRQRRKNVDHCRAVSHAALRDDSGHGCESEVKAITSWVAPLSDLWPPSLHNTLSVFSPQHF